MRRSHTGKDYYYDPETEFVHHLAHMDGEENVTLDPLRNTAYRWRTLEELQLATRSLDECSNGSLPIVSSSETIAQNEVRCQDYTQDSVPNAEAPAQQPDPRCHAAVRAIGRGRPHLPPLRMRPASSLVQQQV